MPRSRERAADSHVFIRSDEGLTLETSAFRISVRWPIYIINSVDKTKFLNILFGCHYERGLWRRINKSCFFEDPKKATGRLEVGTAC